MAIYPLPTLGPTIDATGISIPAYEDVYQSLIASFKSIYGADIYVSPDSQDGQWLAILASVITDCNQAAVAVFQSFSPTYSQGTFLSSLVKLNGLAREKASNSTAVGTVVGQVGTTILNGVVKDINGNLWGLPASVVIPISGEVSVTVTALAKGAINASSGSINSIYNPQLGWQSFTNITDAVAGAPVETDAELRQRQANSTALPALGIKESIYAAVGNVLGVTRHTVYENDTGGVDSNGIPAHSIAVVAQGGAVSAIASAIAGKKAPGVPTYGNTSQVVYDSIGLPTTINFFPLDEVTIYYSVSIKALPGYVSSTGDVIKATLANFTSSLSIGEDVYYGQAFAQAALSGIGLGQTFYVTSFALGVVPAPSGTSNIAILFNQAAAASAATVSLSVS